jgi:hypothetical protein
MKKVIGMVRMLVGKSTNKLAEKMYLRKAKSAEIKTEQILPTVAESLNLESIKKFYFRDLNA